MQHVTRLSVPGQDNAWLQIPKGDLFSHSRRLSLSPNTALTDTKKRRRRRRIRRREGEGEGKREV